MMQSHHIALRLSKGGGPEPQYELRRFYESWRNGSEGLPWIATRKRGAGFTQSLTVSG